MRSPDILLNLMSNDPEFYLNDIKHIEFREYLRTRLKDLIPVLKEENIELDMWSFRKFISFIVFLERNNGFIDMGLSISDKGEVIVQQIRPKYFMLRFARKCIYYMNSVSDLMETTSFHKLKKFLKNLPVNPVF